MAKLLRESGLLFEVNRRVLHPLGYALAITMDGSAALEFTLLDNTADPEGMCFEEELFKEALTRFRAWMNKVGNVRVEVRKQALGYVVQGEELKL